MAKTRTKQPVEIVPTEDPGIAADTDDAGRQDESGPARWKEMVRATAEEARERLASLRSLRLSARDRERLARRLKETVDAALDVPPDLPRKIAANVRKLRRGRDDAGPVELAWERTRLRARRAAAAGAVTTMPSLLPGVGPALAALGMVADWKYVAEQQRDLVLEIAEIFGVPVADPTEEVRGLFLASTGVAFGAVRAGDAAARAAARQVARHWVARLVPAAGAAVSGGLNYVSTLAVGRVAIARFAHAAGVRVEGLVPEAAHPALPRLRQAVVSAVQAAALGDGALPLFTPEQRDIVVRLSRHEREELLDLAVVGAAAEEGISPEEEPVLAQLARELGFTAAELDEAVQDATGGLREARTRLGRLFASLRRGGARVSQGLWTRARKLARGRPGRGD